jgi:hypothetical protein
MSVLFTLYGEGVPAIPARQTFVKIRQSAAVQGAEQWHAFVSFDTF